MQETENVKSAIEAAASNPTVAAAVAAGNISMGTLVWFDIVHGLLSLISLGVGIVTGLVILGIQLIRLEKAWRERRTDTGEKA